MTGEPSSSSATGTLQALGYGEPFASAMAELARDPSNSQTQPALQPARVVAVSHEIYRLATADGAEAPARLAGKLREAPDRPAVGDWVAAVVHPDGAALIQHLLPRRTRLSRKVAGERTQEQVVAANVDTVFLVMGLDGDYNLRRLERFAVMAWESGAQPVVILTKADLHEDAVGARLDAQSAAPGMPVFAVSALAGEGLAPLASWLGEGSTVALIGSSGVGKSTLVNRLAGAEVMRTSAVREGDDRGRHTTTHRQMIRLPTGGLLIDNPGVREIQLWADEGALETAFEDLAELAQGCRFRDCRHQDEPGCEVLAAVEDGRLDAARLASWHELDRELASLEKRQDVAAYRRADRVQGRMYKRIISAKASRREGKG
jgi:ribosome biogenesis GTPase